MNLKDQVIIITGAGGGIGRAASLICAGYGAKIAVLDIKEDMARETVRLIKEAGGEAIASYVDVRDRASVRTAVQKTVDTWGRVDGLFNNAGVPKPAMFLDITDQDFDFLMSVNFKGMFIVAQETARVMKAQGGGRIVNASSIAGIREQVGSMLYCTSKAAVAMMTKVMAAELSEFGVTTVALCPGNVGTEFLMGALKKHAADENIPYEEYLKQNSQKIPLRRMATPEEIGEIVAFLFDRRSQYIDGNSLLVSGGMVM